MQRYVSKSNGLNKVGETPTKNTNLVTNSNKGFYPGHPKWGGRQKGTPNKLPSDILDALVTAMDIVGYDADVIQKVKKNGQWVLVKNENARKRGMVNYFVRSLELYRKEFIPVIGRMAAPAMLSMLVQNKNGDTAVEARFTDDSLAALEDNARQLGITVNIFHGDPGNRPVPLVIDNDE